MLRFRVMSFLFIKKCTLAPAGYNSTYKKTKINTFLKWTQNLSHLIQKKLLFKYLSFFCSTLPLEFFEKNRILKKKIIF